MAFGDRKSQRVDFERGIHVYIMGIDGTWRRDCMMVDVSQTGARLRVEGSLEGLDLKEFFLLLSSTGFAYRRCSLIRLSGESNRRRVSGARQERQEEGLHKTAVRESSRLKTIPDFGRLIFLRSTGVRNGSKASFWSLADHFRSAPQNGHFRSLSACLKGATTGPMHRAARACRICRRLSITFGGSIPPQAVRQT